MPLLENPFQSIFITEQLSHPDFPKLFSPVIVDRASSDVYALFRPGNVILKGTQGSGKSMLLALLKPGIRIAYHQKEIPFPIPAEFCRFISGGINLIRCGAIGFGQRLGGSAKISDSSLKRYFGDFVNYWIVEDILATIESLKNYNKGGLCSSIGLNKEAPSLESLARALKSQDCWFGFLDDVLDFSELKKKINDRILQYRRFLNGHFDDLPGEIKNTITDPGQPISQMVVALKECGVISETTSVFVRIDQCETMIRLEAKARERELYLNLFSTVLKMLGSRNAHVSYRLGGRRYVFRNSSERRMLGTTEPIEDFRNYITVDIDEILRRAENRKSWIFPELIEDIFRRRLKFSGYNVPDSLDNSLSYVLGGGKVAIKEKIRKYTGNSGGPFKSIDIDETWPDPVKQSLEELARTDILSAKLGEAWVRQQMEQKNPVLPVAGSPFPWDQKAKRWWKKERVFLASMQIAAQRAQRMIWAREKDIMDLSSGSIVVFLSLMQHIWHSWLRSLPRSMDFNDSNLPKIDDILVQSEGITEASSRWYDKIREDPNGDSRQRFVDFLGHAFRNRLRSDKKMSYPGNNGITLKVNELKDEANKDVFAILQDASDYGVMVDMKHTPKSASRGESRKWYLHPVYAPYFQIPAMHTKEPMYVSVNDVRSWLEKAKVLLPREGNPATDGWAKKKRMGSGGLDDPV